MSETEGRLIRHDDGSLHLSGRFDYDSVIAVRAQGEREIRALEGHSCRIDLSKVAASNSVFMALLLSWLRLCESRGIALELTGIPDSLYDMARVSGLDAILPMTHGEQAPV